MFVGVFALLLTLALIPGAFAQEWTGATPEVEETEVEEIYRRGVISALYVWFAYEMFPILGKIFKVLQAPGYDFMGISGFELSAKFFVNPVGRLFASLGGERSGEVLIDTMTGASPKMAPAFYYAFGEVAANFGVSRVANWIHGVLLAFCDGVYILLGAIKVASPFVEIGLFTLWDEAMNFAVGGIRYELWPEYYEPTVIIRLNRAGGAIGL